MKANNQARPSRFWLFLLCYALLILAATLALLRFGWSFLSGYEASMPQHFMDSYIESLDEAHVQRIVDSNLPDYNPALIDRESVRSYVLEQLQGASFSYRKNGSQSAQNRNGYDILINGVKRGTVVISRDENPSAFTFSPWVLESESFSFSLPDADVIYYTIPESWQLVCNGSVLDRSHITESGIELAPLHEYYGLYDIETLCTYGVEIYVQAPEVYAIDSRGQSHTLSENAEENLELFMADYYDNDNGDVQWLSKAFVERYIAYTSNSNGNASGNLANLRRLIVSGTDLERRLIDTQDSLYWTHGKGYTIQEIRFNRILHLGEIWISDVTYTVDVNGTGGAVTTTVNSGRLLIVDQNGTLLIERFSSY